MCLAQYYRRTSWQQQKENPVLQTRVLFPSSSEYLFTSGNLTPFTIIKFFLKMILLQWAASWLHSPGSFTEEHTACTRNMAGSQRAAQVGWKLYKEITDLKIPNFCKSIPSHPFLRINTRIKKWESHWPSNLSPAGFRSFIQENSCFF